MPAIVLDKLLPAITWTLVHSLWQGLILTILAGLIILLTRRSTAALRYAGLCTLFFLFLGGVGITFFVEWNQEMQPLTRDNAFPGQPGPYSFFSIDQLWNGVTDFLNQNTQWIVLAWTLVFLILSGRIIQERIFIRKLKVNRTWGVEAIWKIKMQALAEEMGIQKTVSLVESAIVKMPIVIGYFKPVVMVPIGMMNQLTPGEVEAVLLHELAHIRRHDYLVNYLQRVAETLLFFNPGLLWVSSLLRAEREACCDEIAIEQTGNKRQFVEALIRCKENALSSPAFSLGLFGNRNQLLQRLNRIVLNRNKSLSPFEASFFGVSILILSLVLSGWNDRTNWSKTPASLVATNQPVREIVVQISEQEAKKKNKQIAVNVKPAHLELVNKRATQPKKKPTREIISEINAKKQIPEIIHEPLLETTVQLNERTTKRKIRKIEAEQRRVMVDWNRIQLEKAHQMQINRTKAERYREQAEREREFANQYRQQAEKDRLHADRDRIEIQKLRQENSRQRQRMIVQ